MSVAIAEPWAQEEIHGGRPVLIGGWICATCKRAVTTEGFVAAPIPRHEAARRHNAHAHPRRLRALETPPDDFSCCVRPWLTASCAGCMNEIERDPHEPNDRRAWRHTGSDGGTVHLATPYEDVIA